MHVCTNFQPNYSANDETLREGIENPMYQPDEMFNDQKNLISRNPSIASMPIYDTASPHNIPRSTSGAPENNSNTLRSARKNHQIL